MTNVSGKRAEEFKKLDDVIAVWKDQPGGLLPIMQQAQEICGCVDEAVQHYISEATGVPMTTIYGVSTFYSLFTLVPKGKYQIGMCLGTACYVRGAQKVFDELQNQLAVEAGGTTEDGLFTLEALRCIGCCGLAPAMIINGTVYGNLQPADVTGIIEKYRALG